MNTPMMANTPRENVAAYAAMTMFTRFAEPEEVAPTVVFLASGLADHATGTTVDVNGASYVR